LYANIQPLFLIQKLHDDMHQDSSVPKTPASASVGGATPATAARGNGGQQQPPLPPPRVAKPREGAHGIGTLAVCTNFEMILLYADMSFYSTTHVNILENACQHALEI
jgi:hypothetical protein